MAYNASGLGFSTIGLDGVNLTLTYTVNTTSAIGSGYTPETPGAPFALGQVARAVDGSEYVFVKHAQATTVGQVGFMDTSWNFTTITSTNAAGLDGAYVGVASQLAASAASGDYGWVQVKGGCPALNVAASTLANAELFTSSTAGRLTSTSGGVPISGVVLTAAEGGTAGNASATVNYPVIGGPSAGGGTLPVFGNETITALNTVGAGTITAAGIVGGVTARGGAQAGAAFTDTTDTAANLVIASPTMTIGQSWEWLYQNNTNATATITGGTGVTVSGITQVPENSWARFLVTYTAASTFTVASIAEGQISAVPPAQYTTSALSTGTLAAGVITGAAFVVLVNSGATPGTQTTRTAAQMLADTPGAQVGFTYMLRIVNTGAGTLTLAGGTGVTVSGTATVATNVFRDYTVNFASATTATITSVGSGTSP